MEAGSFCQVGCVSVTGIEKLEIDFFFQYKVHLSQIN